MPTLASIARVDCNNDYVSKKRLLNPLLECLKRGLAEYLPKEQLSELLRGSYSANNQFAFLIVRILISSYLHNIPY